MLARHTDDRGWTERPPDELLFVDEGRSALSVHGDATFLWEISSGRPLHVFRESSRAQLAARLSPDRRRLLIVAADRTATLWEWSSREKIRSFGDIRTVGNGRRQSFWLSGTRFSDDGRRVISRSHGGRGIHQLDTDTGQAVSSFYLLGNGSEAVALTPDSRLAATSPGLVRYRKAGTNTLVPTDETQ